MRILQRAPLLALFAMATRDVQALQPGPVLTSRARAIQTVSQAMERSERGEFPAARLSLERSLAACGTTPGGRQCRVLISSGLGSLLQRRAAVDRRNRDSLYLGAVAYYDKILTEVPNDPDAVYGKAVAYRALGPHEWQEAFFRQAPTLDPGNKALYLTFQGDYYASARRWPDAARVYKEAVQQDSDQDGARSGLVDALSTLGPQSRRELLQYARGWELRYPGSAADAYRAVLVASFAPGGQRDAVADSAMVGLVRVQSRNRLAVGAVPPGVSPEWTPVREIRAFQNTARGDTAPWWMEDPERTAALAQAALAAGRVAASAKQYDLAEQLWSQGLSLPGVRRSSTIALDLQRELALLYFHQPSLDPNRRKFEALEQNIFEGKMGALSTGDLEAAQRYHTTLGLIYLERGVWRRPDARSAERQLTWALDKAEERVQRQRFYQPLPELRLVLARGLDSTGDRRESARRYAEAARAFLDVDDFAAADSAGRNANRLGGDATGAMRVVVLRSGLARGGAAARRTCMPGVLAALDRTGDSAFVARQRFKMLADCTKVDTAANQRQHAAKAFDLVDRVRVTLIGGSDVARFERVMQSLLAPFGISFQAAHLDPGPSPGGPAIQISMPGETVPLWYAASLDDVIAARIVSAMGSAVRPFPLSVAAGVVSIPPNAGVSRSLLTRLETIPGVKAVQVRALAY